jgi:WYL domain
MYEIGTEVIYHGSLGVHHGEIYTITGYTIPDRYTLGDGTRPDAVWNVRHSSITPIRDREGAERRAVLAAAIAGEQPVMITYIDVDGSWTTRTIEPYELHVTRDGHEIVRAMCQRSREPRSFRVDRIHAVDLMPGGFHLERPDLDREGEALDRIRAEIAEVSPYGYGFGDAMHWTPDSPIPSL